MTIGALVMIVLFVVLIGAYVVPDAFIYVPLLTPFIDETAGGSLTFVLVLYFFGAIALALWGGIKASEAVDALAKRLFPLPDDEVVRRRDKKPTAAERSTATVRPRSAAPREQATPKPLSHKAWRAIVAAVAWAIIALALLISDLVGSSRGLGAVLTLYVAAVPFWLAVALAPTIYFARTYDAADGPIDAVRRGARLLLADKSVEGRTKKLTCAMFALVIAWLNVVPAIADIPYLLHPQRVWVDVVSVDQYEVPAPERSSTTTGFDYYQATFRADDGTTYSVKLSETKELGMARHPREGARPYLVVLPHSKTVLEFGQDKVE